MRKARVKNDCQDFPSGLVVKNPPSNVRDVVLIPGQGTKIPSATGQLSPCTETTEPRCSRDHSETGCKRQPEETTRHNERTLERCNGEPACHSAGPAQTEKRFSGF